MKSFKMIACILMATATMMSAHAKDDKKMDSADAVAVLRQPATGKQVGTVSFHQKDGKIEVKVHVEGLKPNSSHGFHVHDYGDARAQDGTSAGGHFNPAGHDHAGPDTEMRHAGDMGNLKANSKGVVETTLTFENFTLDPCNKEGVVGRSVVLHAGTDDLKSQPTGDAGGRWAVGVIGWAKPKDAK